MMKISSLLCGIIFLLTLTGCIKEDDSSSLIAESFIKNYHQIENYDLTYELDVIVEKMMNDPDQYLVIRSENLVEATDEIIDEMNELILNHFDYQISDSYAESLHANRYIRNVVTTANEKGYTVTVNKTTLEEIESSEEIKVYNHNSEITITNSDGKTEKQNIKGQVLLKKENDEWKVHQYTITKNN